MPVVEITEKELLAIRAVTYGCNTNKRLQGASFVSGIGTENEEMITFYEAINVVDSFIDKVK